MNHAEHILTIRADQPGPEIQSTMWGIFFEDINFAADGGLYAELVKNRSFQFSPPLMGWHELRTDPFSLNRDAGSASVINRGIDHVTDSRFLRIYVNADNTYALVNEGFNGMGVRGDVIYDFSMIARREEGNVTVHVDILGDHEKPIGSTDIEIGIGDWHRCGSELVASKTSAKAKLQLTFRGKGVIDIDMVSLFPTDTWRNRRGGLRSDLVQLLADLKPGFLRFPGGCIVEGRDLSQRYQWKKTVGAVGSREWMINRWSTELSQRPAHDYYQSFGLGFFEYFQLAEDIGAAPLPVLNCGMACQFNTGELVAMEQLTPYVQDALDLIEFANGPVDSEWGGLRARMGHPEPFHLEMIGIGNEQWGKQYIERYQVFQEAIKARYPKMVVISGSGPFPDGELFEYAWQELKANAQVVDEHYYRNPAWFFENAGRYDRYDRSGPKVCAGEYAAQSVAVASPENRNSWWCALSEAAFMTGLERNADVVHLASYAPLMAHTERWQWTPNLIWFDNLSSYGTPSYHVQKLFSNNRGTHTLPIHLGGKTVKGQHLLYASAAWDGNSAEVVIKIVNISKTTQTVGLLLEGVRIASSSCSIKTLTSLPDTVNSLSDPCAICPVEKSLSLAGTSESIELMPCSLSVLRICVQGISA